MEFITTLLTAVALSMDAFSLAILYGTLGLTNKKRITLSIIVGMYHFIMPLLGSLFGKIILKYIPIETNILVGFIFIILSIQMFISLKKEEKAEELKGLLSLLIFGFTVSIDSFSVGIALNTISKYLLMPPIIFSITSALFTYFGTTIGKVLNNNFDKKATLLGSVILFILSLYYLF